MVSSTESVVARKEEFTGATGQRVPVPPAPLPVFCLLPTAAFDWNILGAKQRSTSSWMRLPKQLQAPPSPPCHQTVSTRRGCPSPKQGLKKRRLSRDFIDFFPGASFLEWLDPEPAWVPSMYTDLLNPSSWSSNCPRARSFG